jgi:hypothetical protein
MESDFGRSRGNPRAIVMNENRSGAVRVDEAGEEVGQTEWICEEGGTAAEQEQHTSIPN